MAQLTAMQTLFTNLESIDIKVPQFIKDAYLQMEKEQIVDAFDIACEDKDRIGKEYYYDTYGE